MTTVHSTGHITITDQNLPRALDAARAFADQHKLGTISTVNDLADLLVNVAGGDTQSMFARHEIDVMVDHGQTVLDIAVPNGRIDSAWGQLMCVLAFHGATGEFTHHTPDDADERRRTRLADSTVYDEPALDIVYAGDTVHFVGQLQKSSADPLDLLIPKPTEDEVFSALIDALQSRGASGVPAEQEEMSRRELVEALAADLGLAWTIHRITASRSTSGQ